MEKDWGERGDRERSQREKELGGPGGEGAHTACLSTAGAERTCAALRGERLPTRGSPRSAPHARLLERRCSLPAAPHALLPTRGSWRGAAPHARLPRPRRRTGGARRGGPAACTETRLARSGIGGCGQPGQGAGTKWQRGAEGHGEGGQARSISTLLQEMSLNATAVVRAKLFCGRRIAEMLRTGIENPLL